MEFSRPEGWVAIPSSPPGDLPNPGMEPRSLALQADSLPAEPPGNPKNTGVGSLSLLQQIFSIQELNRGFLHCSRILYRLNYQGSPPKDFYNFPENIIVLAFRKSKISFKSIFVLVWVRCTALFFSMWIACCLSTMCWKDYSFPFYCLSTHLQISWL